MVSPRDADGLHACIGGGFQIHGGIADDDKMIWGVPHGLGDPESAFGVGFVRDAILLAEHLCEVNFRKHRVGDGAGELVGFVRKHGHLDAILLEIVQQVMDSRVGACAHCPAEVVVILEKGKERLDERRVRSGVNCAPDEHL